MMADMQNIVRPRQWVSDAIMDFVGFHEYFSVSRMVQDAVYVVNSFVRQSMEHYATVIHQIEVSTMREVVLDWA